MNPLSDFQDKVAYVLGNPSDTTWLAIWMSIAGSGERLNRATAEGGCATRIMLAIGDYGFVTTEHGPHNPLRAMSTARMMAAALSRHS
jgi:hypothetical protein